MIRLAFLLTCLAAPLAAQTVAECDWRAQAQTLVEPWEVNSRTFAQGAVRVALVDTVEPALGALHLLVLSPPRDEQGARSCKLVSYDGIIGFAALDLAAMTSRYVPGLGLELLLPSEIITPEGDGTTPAKLWVIIDQSTGEVATFMEQEPE